MPARKSEDGQLNLRISLYIYLNIYIYMCVLCIYLIYIYIYLKRKEGVRLPHCFTCKVSGQGPPKGDSDRESCRVNPWCLGDQALPSFENQGLMFVSRRNGENPMRSTFQWGKSWLCKLVSGIFVWCMREDMSFVQRASSLLQLMGYVWKSCIFGLCMHMCSI